MNKLKEAAMAAFEKQQTENAVIEEQNRQAAIKTKEANQVKTKELFEKHFGIELDPEMLDGTFIKFDNYDLFGMTMDGSFIAGGSWRIIKRCKNLEPDNYDHANVTDGWFSTLADLGSFLDANKGRDICYSCQREQNPNPAPAPLTTEQKLLNVLREFIGENSSFE